MTVKQPLRIHATERAAQVCELEQRNGEEGDQSSKLEWIIGSATHDDRWNSSDSKRHDKTWVRLLIAPRPFQPPSHGRDVKFS